MANRKSIPKDLAAQVLFESDRTCCVCRLEKDHVQVHHIDGDPSNNSRDNLAVLCLNCHSDAHTDGAFVRNLTPEVVELYDQSWREIVGGRLTAGGKPQGEAEFRREALLEAGLECHSWKNHLMTLDPNWMKPGNATYGDVWDRLEAEVEYEFTDESFKRFLPLFDQGILDVQRRFDRLIQLFPDALPYELRTLLVRARRQLSAERTTYLRLPALFKGIGSLQSKETQDHFMRERFIGVVRTLAKVARDSDKLREELEDEPGDGAI